MLYLADPHQIGKTCDLGYLSNSTGPYQKLDHLKKNETKQKTNKKNSFKENIHQEEADVRRDLSWRKNGKRIDTFSFGWTFNLHKNQVSTVFKFIMAILKN